MHLRSFPDGLAQAFRRVGLGLRRRVHWGSRGARLLIDAILYPSDLYASVTTHREKIGPVPRLWAPRTFNEHIQARKLFDRDPVYTRLADKLEVREYVAREAGSDYLPALYWQGEDIREAPRADLPPRFVIKSNHAVGTVILVESPAEVDWAEVGRQTRGWLEMDISTLMGEWHYRWIPPRLYIEELLPAPAGQSAPVDYKIFCFGGQPVFIEVMLGRGRDPRILMTDPDLRPLPVRGKAPAPEEPLEKPVNLAEMLWVAERLSRHFRFVRVDLYNIEGRVVFGELTFTPAGGAMQLDPGDWDYWLGEHFRNAATMPERDPARPHPTRRRWVGSVL
ncbi:MAG: ATP-grasp fold amidoligase family protein [Thiohalorhabdus sp.]|uniref:ATP-grasp fold amidoligase family protein n=1 Tax=Thiohalorhabdus sp. TaxID=3094134 RepID=UPI0039803670